MESHRRSIIKTLSWRVLATAITAGVAFVVTGELRFAAAIGALDTFLKLGIYYTHERVWNRLNFGRSRSPDYQI